MLTNQRLYDIITRKTKFSVSAGPEWEHAERQEQGFCGKERE